MLNRGTLRDSTGRYLLVLLYGSARLLDQLFSFCGRFLIKLALIHCNTHVYIYIYVCVSILYGDI